MSAVEAVPDRQPSADEALLRRFEPILRLTDGERFLPLDPAVYVAACSLWVKRPGRAADRLVPRGELTLQRLSEPSRDVFGAVRYLKFASPWTPTRLAQQAVRFQRALRKDFHAGPGRLARVGYVSRLADAFFTLGLLLRGRVPGGAAAAAHDAYSCLPGAGLRRYSGRVVRRDGWIVLQYWFLYAFNNWRSGFFGANDHEADWEMVTIYASQREDGAIMPEWVAYSTHDDEGDDLRRRWDDPELELVGEHPVVYAAAGSHASYYTGGEYLAELELTFLRPLSRLAAAVRSLWHGVLGQYRSGDELREARAVRPHGPRHGAEDPTATLGQQPAGRIFRVPFVDYARGDGLAIGPGQEERWARPRVIDDETPWVVGYRGLWGLYARDPFSGEDAPAGPRHDRDGSVRRAWHDPLGWAGLHKVVPWVDRLERMRQQRADLRTRVEGLDGEARQMARDVEALGLEAEAMHGQPHLADAHRQRQARIEELGARMAEVQERLSEERAVLTAVERHVRHMEAGERAPPRAHMRRPHRPAPETELRLDRWAELWAALSIGLGMILFVAVWSFLPAYRVLGLIVALALFVFVEAGFRGRLTRLVTSVTLSLAAVASLIMAYEFFWEAVVVTILVTGSYIMWENVRELWV